ncbi:MAG TPA: PilT/PilU family type 4a pilus ATPase, partial [Acidimicrobiia bacterium]|nr:PilT/PilU family type 4a pilus ATPase [Acidimicrobiia bacterium]
QRIASQILPEERAAEFAAEGDADFAYSVASLGRFRVNVFRQRGSIGLVFRQVLPGIPSFEALGLPPVVRGLSEEPRGLVLVTGPAASGKTTTLAAMIDHINETQQKHIVTIEDPIEVLHPDKQSIVNQREIGTDTGTFATALQRVLRQDPDVIFISEMRDPETVSAAIAAAETGHLVLSTMYTVGVIDTVNRLVDFFPPHQQRQVRMSVATALRGIVSQRLLDRADGQGRVPAVEVLVGTDQTLEALVNPDRTQDLERVMAEGDYYGMQTFDQNLLALFNANLINRREALANSANPRELRLHLERSAGGTGEHRDETLVEPSSRPL